MNARQKRFVEEYLVDPNATRCARRAGYSKRTADRIGSRLLRNVEVAGAVKQAQDERAERTRITADMVVQELALHAFGRMGDFLRQEDRQDCRGARDAPRGPGTAVVHQADA